MLRPNGRATALRRCGAGFAGAARTRPDGPVDAPHRPSSSLRQGRDPDTRSESRHRPAMLVGATSPGPLAQLAEQWTFNPLVVGSSPTGPTGLRGRETASDLRRSALTSFGWSGHFEVPEPVRVKARWGVVCSVPRCVAGGRGTMAVTVMSRPEVPLAGPLVIAWCENPWASAVLWLE